MNITTRLHSGRCSPALDLIATWAADDANEGLMSRKLVIDRLLDLRNLLSGPGLVGVDGILANVPGVMVVESSWWREQIAWLERLAATQFETEGLAT
jgi:hypothetical protein